MSTSAQSTAARKEAKEKDKEKDKEEQRRLQAAVALLELQPALLGNPTVSTMCSKYAKMGGNVNPDAFKLDLLRMLAVSRR
ncbi:B48A [miniopterid betaherpesvirus 1]|uniref:Small capsomere-interacting protein n=1 Tax=miniopterid betaherpesvirus 1 TaxID=3070189 RepID=I3VQ35_9BETA|nr:B48A [miniopterid betaherpesvirus 1]AFK83879.1 B48A [miniopterid betaherpesvirus 1]